MEVDKTIGAVSWMDLTVPQADDLRDFYKNVVGWKTWMSAWETTMIIA